MVDWTEILIYAIGHAFGAIHVWLRLHHDAELGRSLRPEAYCAKPIPGTAPPMRCTRRKGHRGDCI